MNEYVRPCEAEELIRSLEDESVTLLATDPPYFKVLKKKWDNQWSDIEEYVKWMYHLLLIARPKLKPNGSIIFFGGTGMHGHRPFFKLIEYIEAKDAYCFRDLITWKKRRGYGTAYAYLYCREEIAWYSKSFEKKNIVFNVPLLDEKRGYKGFNSKYPAKSEFKRVSNVWEIGELMRPEREAQKPLEIFNRIVSTHSNPGDLVVDPFVGWGTCGVSALTLGRQFIGSENIPKDAIEANSRCKKAADEMDRILYKPQPLVVGFK